MLEVENLSTYFELEDGVVKAVDDVSFKVGEGEIFGLVGESGSGKSTVALSILRLIAPPGKIAGGQILLNNIDLLQLGEKEMIKVRGAKIAMIFQDPFTSLNPVFTVGDQIAEAIRLHQGLNRQAAWGKAVAMLEKVQISQAAERAKNYPHQFSGGMQQRVMIAMALACQPQLLIADEPTTALDVTIQAEILKLLQELQQSLGLAIIYITHNFGIVKKLCRRVAVMHRGKIIEEGETDNIIGAPREEYTRRLIGALRALKAE